MRREKWKKKIRWRREAKFKTEEGKASLENTVNFVSFRIPQPPAPGKFMVCTSHRLQCKMPNQTNHKFPGYGAEKYVS